MAQKEYEVANRPPYRLMTDGQGNYWVDKFGSHGISRLPDEQYELKTENMGTAERVTATVDGYTLVGEYPPVDGAEEPTRFGPWAKCIVAVVILLLLGIAGWKLWPTSPQEFAATEPTIACGQLVLEPFYIIEGAPNQTALICTGLTTDTPAEVRLTHTETKQTVTLTGTLTALDGLPYPAHVAQVDIDPLPAAGLWTVDYYVNKQAVTNTWVYVVGLGG